MNASIYAKETGIVEAIRLRFNYYKQFEGYGHHALLDTVFFDMIYNEKNINLILNTVVCGCETKDNEITKVYAKHSVNSENYEIEALSYIDATGNGALGYEAKADLWIADGKENESITLYPKKSIKGLSVVFNSNLDGDNYNGMPKSVAKNFTVEIHGKNGILKKNNRKLQKTGKNRRRI